MVTLRTATKDDAAFIETMLVVAVNWDPQRAPLPRDEVLAVPANRHYVDGWPRESDAGVIAEGQHGESVGAAWFRFFDPGDPGYGFVAWDIPEVAVAVVPEHRGEGIGDALLSELEKEARRRGVAALSLSVEVANRAYGLYRRRRYREVARRRATCTMILDLLSAGG